MVNPILKVENLIKVYGKDYSKVTALKDVTFTVEKGEFVSIIGTSGSGKSTLLHIIGGVDSPTSGKILVDGINVFEQNEKNLTLYRRRKVAMIYQFFNLLPMLNVRDNIILPLELDKVELDESHLQRILKSLNLEEKEFYYPNQLSGGQQQRVAIARGLITSPAILLADEPTGNLDSKNTKETMDLLRYSNTKFNQTTIIVTHDERIASQTDRIIQIEDGMIVRDEKI